MSTIPTKLIVGLRNPGPGYEWTRHNVGSHVVEELAKRHSIQFHGERTCHAALSRWKQGESTIVLAMPVTYMNESGRSVQRLLHFTDVSPREMLIVADDIETPWGTVKTAFGGGTRGHNGLKSVFACLGSKDFDQMRIGVGRPHTGTVSDYVLQRFTEEELAELPHVIDQAATMAEEWAVAPATQKI